MIDLSQELILSLIIKSFLTGVALGVIYEGVRIAKMLLGIGQDGRVRKIFSHVFLFFTDLCFCLIFAFCSILLTYNINGGVFRGCVYLCMGLGIVVYRLTLGRLTEKLERWITGIIRKLIDVIIRLTLVPIRVIFSLVCRLYALTIGKIIGTIRRRVTAAREKKKRERAESNAEPACLPCVTEEIKDEGNNAKGARGYKKDGRISFGAVKR